MLAEAAALLQDPNKLLLSPELLPPPTVCWSKTNKTEYHRLVARQFRCGKVSLAERLMASVRAFTIGKPSEETQCEIWNGNIITQAALEPPKPPMQANPAALADMEASQDRPLRMSGRDAACYFDQLALPQQIRADFGRHCRPVNALRYHLNFE